MPEPVAPAAPAAPVAAPPAPPAASPDPSRASQDPMSPENNPQNAIYDLIARRGQRKAPGTVAPASAPSGGVPPAAPAATPSAPAAPPTPPAEPPRVVTKTLGAALSGALRFRTKQPDPATPPAPAPPATPPAAPAIPAAPAPPEPPKPEPKKKKVAAPAPLQIDPVKLAQDVAEAAATAVAREMRPGARPSADEEFIATLSDEDRHDYDVAKFMSENDPRLKGADIKLLSNLRRTADYVQRWEAANPGKKYNSKDEDHDDFFQSIQAPWREHEFRAAESDMRESQRASKKDAERAKEIDQLKEENAKLALAQSVDSTLNAAFGGLAQGIDESLVTALAVPGGFEKLNERDPVTARHLAGALGAIRPMVETIVHLDDPAFRVKYNPNDPKHRAWGDLLMAAEAKYAGTQLESGLRFATRAAYAKMSRADQMQHFYLTTDHLLSELVENAAEDIKGKIAQEKQHIEKVAEAMGYTKAPAAPAAPPSPAPNTPPAPPATPSSSSVAKPDSPASGGSVKSDTKEPPDQNVVSRIGASVHKALFAR